MSVQSEITRITTAKSAIATAITGKGVTVPSGTKIDGMAALIDTITTGGELESITITTPPTKTSYIAGEDFDPTGMEVTAVVSGVSIPVTGWTYSPATLTGDTTAVTVSLTVNGVTKTAGQVVDVAAYSTVFAENTWETIAHIAQSGKAAEIWNVGDEKTLTINGIDYPVIIYGFNHYELSEEDNYYNDPTYNNGTGKAAILLGLKGLYNDKSNMGKTYWYWAPIRTTLQEDVFSALPEEISTFIRSTKTLYRNSTGYCVYCSDKLICPSSYELVGTTAYGDLFPKMEGEQFAYYEAGNSTIKTLPDGTSPDLYMTRSIRNYRNSDNTSIPEADPTYTICIDNTTGVSEGALYYSTAQRYYNFVFSI